MRSAPQRPRGCGAQRTSPGPALAQTTIETMADSTPTMSTSAVTSQATPAAIVRAPTAARTTAVASSVSSAMTASTTKTGATPVVARTVVAASRAQPALSIGSSAPSQGHFLDPMLRPWQLYDLSGAIEPDSQETMVSHWQRMRALRGKSTESLDYNSLQYSWCALIRRWNDCHAKGEPFIRWLEFEEEKRMLRSLSALRERVCNIAWDTRRICLANVLEGCNFCYNGGARPTRVEWDAEVAGWPLDEHEREWVGRYERAVWEHLQAASRGGGSGTRGREARARGRSRDQDREGRHQSRDSARDYSCGHSRTPECIAARGHSARRRSRSRSPRGSQWLTEPIRRSPSPPPRRSSRRRSTEVPGDFDWHRTRGPDPEHHAGAARAAPMYPRLGDSRAIGHDSGAVQARRPYSYGACQRGSEADLHGPQHAPRPSEPRPWSQSVGEGHCDGMPAAESSHGSAPRSAAPEQLSFESIVIAESDQAKNDAAKAIEQAERAEERARAVESRAERVVQRMLAFCETMRQWQREMDALKALAERRRFE